MLRPQGKQQRHDLRIALDGQPLASSKRILLILASDAQNTGMLFADADRRELANLGTLPAQILRTRADLSLQVANGQAFHLFSLHLNGSKGDGNADPGNRRHGSSRSGFS